MPAELVELTLEEVSAVDRPANPHAKVTILKRAGGDPAPAPTEDYDVPPTATEALQKALEPDAADSRQEREHKAVLKAGIERGLVTTERAMAEMMLDTLAKSARRADPDKSYEQHYVRQLGENPELARLID